MRKLLDIGVAMVALGVACAAAQEGAFYPAGTLAETSGELVAWGSNAQGQLNLPTSGARLIDATRDGSLVATDFGSTSTIFAGVGAGPRPPGLAVPLTHALSLGAFHGVTLNCIDCSLDGAFVPPGVANFWGDNTYGQRNNPLFSFSAVAAGTVHNIGLAADGTLRGWGLEGPRINVPSGTYTAIAAGSDYNIAIATDGTLRTWGEEVAAPPGGIFTGIAAGKNFGIGIRSSGALEYVGYSLPVALPSGSFLSAAAGDSHGLAIRADGSLIGWGGNGFGQINVPAGVFTAVAAGENHSLALRARTSYTGDLKVSYTGPATGANGLKASLNRNVTVAGNAIIEAPLNFFNNSTLNVAGKVTFQGQANFNGAGAIVSTGGGMEFLQTPYTFVPAGVELLNFGPLMGSGSIQLAGGTLNTGLGPFGVTTGSIIISEGGRLGFIGRGAAQPAALFVDPGGVVKLTGGQRLNTPGNLRLSGELKLDGDRSQFDGGVELRAGGATVGGGANLTITSTGKLEVDDATLNFPGGADLQANSQLRILGGTNELFGSLNASGTMIAFSGVNVFRGTVNNSGVMWLGFDSLNSFFGDYFQFGELRIGEVLNSGVPTTAMATFRGSYRGLGAIGDGNVVFENRVTPFSPTGPIATAAFDTNVRLGNAATLELRLGEGSLLSRLAVTRNLHLGGALSFQALDLSRAFAIGESFDLLDWGTLSGTFSTLVLPQLGPGQIWDTSQLYTTGVLRVIAAAGLAGDYNQDRIVDAADYTTWCDGLGGMYAAADYDTWKNNFGAAAGPSGTLGAAVPEPAAALLFALGCAGVIALRFPTRRRGAAGFFPIKGFPPCVLSSSQSPRS
jgi:hypothetical protein